MRKLTYFAVIEPSNDGGYGVYFPDLSGCTSYGKNFDEAVRMAKEALGLHIYAMEKDNELVPEPSPLYKLNIDPETVSGYAITPINIFPDMVKNEIDNRAVRTNVTLPAWLKELAEERKVNFSQLLQSSLKEYLNVEANS